MSDFIDRLVQRSLPEGAQAGSQPKLKPRLPSLFEAPGGDIPSPEPTPLPPGEPGPLGAMRNLEHPASGPSPTLIAAATANSHPTASAVAGAGQSPPIETAGERQPIGALGPPGEPALRPVLMPQVIGHEPAWETAPEDKILALAALLPRLAPLPLQPPSGPAQIRGNRAQQVGGKTRDGENSGGTTVRVSIGRIEVRAVHPPQPASPPHKTPPQPKLSLEDYLRRRNEGKR
jgi:hypothetical protein